MSIPHATEIRSAINRLNPFRPASTCATQDWVRLMRRAISVWVNPA